jgi:NAD(P)-dependent dehydrogenase (short-subunit alcohol dehydrogenase family)
MQDKIVLITGGNCGIGKSTAIGLAKLGATVVIAARNRKKGARAVEDIRRKSQNDQVFCLECDLSSFQSVQSAVACFKTYHQKLDVLINNAGLFCSHLKKTKEGFELQFGVNYLGHFLMTQELLPLLHQSDDPRIINVSSIAYMHGTIDFDNVYGEKKPYNGLKAYAQSKLANVLFTRELARRHPTILSNCLHPGVVRTGFGNKHSTWYLSLFWNFWKVFMRSPNKGAETPIYLATQPLPLEMRGAFFDENQQERTVAGHGHNDILAKQLWDRSMTWIKN